MGDLFPSTANQIPGQQTPPTGGIYIDPAVAFVQATYGRPLRAGPIPRDPKLPLDHPDQTFTDCRSIEGWTNTLYRLMQAAWGFKEGDDSFRFGHSYGMIPQPPANIKGTVIVYEILSMVPGARGKKGKEIKALLREVVPDPTVSTDIKNASITVTEQSDPNSGGRTWIYAQRFDAVVRFMTYADNWEHAIEYNDRLFDLIETYTGLFKQAGLQNILFRLQGQDILHDPPHIQAFPNKSLLYDVTIERTRQVTYAQIEQVLINAGVVNPTTQDVETVLTVPVEGVPETPIIPAQ